jgi:RNA-directed DNA polymerase
VRDGLEASVHGGAWRRRVHHLNDVGWADDCIVTANARPLLAETILPRITAFVAERGVRLSPAKTVMTPITDGFDVLGQTLRQHARRHGKPAQLQTTPSKGSFQRIKTQVKALGKQAVGATPAQRIERRNPVLRGWAHYPRHMLCAETFATLDRFVWRRRDRWTTQRHPDTTGRWLTNRYVPHHVGAAWRCTDPTSGRQIM